MQIFDTHCHYNLDPFAADWKLHWTKAQEEGLVGSLVVGTELSSSLLAIKIAAKDSRLGATVGFHPNEWDDLAVETCRQEQNSSAVHELLEQKINDIVAQLHKKWNDKVIVAIGETGLDYFRLEKYSPEEKQSIVLAQQLALAAHIKLAQEKNLPLILHVRDQGEQAYWDVLRLLKEVSYTGQFILHCVSGPLSYVQEALLLGGYVSVAGNVTYKSAEPLRQIVRSVPADHLLTETDAPFLPPVPFRGKQCEPWMIKHTVEFLQNELNIEPEQCLKNAQALFPKQFVNKAATSANDTSSSRIDTDD